MAKWGIGIRLHTTEKVIEAAINKAEIIRTHVFRGTWHFVAANDIRWMLQITTLHGKKLLSAQFRKSNLDDKTLRGLNKKMEKLLTGNNHLTREEILLELNVKKFIEAGIHPAWITMNAELDGILCNGIMRGKQHTYALLDERLPAIKAIDREEALAQLAKIYFTSHGPATLSDFVWWTGLSITEGKLALELIKPAFQSFQIGTLTYWFKDKGLVEKDDKETIHFLPAFDEFLISYNNRTASISLENQPHAFTKNGIFKPIIVVNGKVVGIWKRSFKKDTTIIETQFFEPVKAARKKIIWQAAEKYGNYIGLRTMIQ
ncbi:winged helix DNA-binding domain-containing protein [Chitinophaga sp. MM2321]|uniref:winged helix DNA-binding domain-containing protein n=1 Tax=Chitinophaga sp. MM2321 TaxID=3137178 RepID=UPI0032D57578